HACRGAHHDVVGASRRAASHRRGTTASREAPRGAARTPGRRRGVSRQCAAGKHHRAEAGPDVAVAFVDAVEETFDLLVRHPAVDSPRYAHELDLPGLRSHPIAGFPFL